MIWKQRGWLKPAWQLWNGEQLLGQLETVSGWRNSALATMSGGDVAFKQRSWWRKEYDAVDLATGTSVAIYAGSSWKSSGILRVGGATFSLKNSLWRSQAEIRDAAGMLMYGFKSTDWFGRAHEITVATGVQFTAEHELVLYFGWFAITQFRNDAEAAAVVS